MVHEEVAAAFFGQPGFKVMPVTRRHIIAKWAQGSGFVLP